MWRGRVVRRLAKSLWFKCGSGIMKERFADDDISIGYQKILKINQGDWCCYRRQQSEWIGDETICQIIGTTMLLAEKDFDNISTLVPNLMDWEGVEVECLFLRICYLRKSLQLVKGRVCPLTGHWDTWIICLQRIGAERGILWWIRWGGVLRVVLEYHEETEEIRALKVKILAAVIKVLYDGQWVHEYFFAGYKCKNQVFV
jgi:hypothetical protein